MKYRISEFVKAGLQAKWTTTKRGKPVIVARKDSESPLYVVDRPMWERANEVGLAQAFEEHTCLGGTFSVPA